MGGSTRRRLNSPVVKDTWFATVFIKEILKTAMDAIGILNMYIYGAGLNCSVF